MFLIYLRDMLQLIMSPTKGWEDISYDSPDVRRLMVGAFIPWLLLTAATEVFPAIYAHDFMVLRVVSMFLVTFLKFFATYFVAGFFFSLFMPSLTHGAAVERLCNTLILFAIGLLALIDIIANCVPVDIPLVNFFPLYVLLIIWRGARYLKVESKHALQFVALSLFSVILPPYLLQLLFSFIIP